MTVYWSRGSEGYYGFKATSHCLSVYTTGENHLDSIYNQYSFERLGQLLYPGGIQVFLGRIKQQIRGSGTVPMSECLQEEPSPAIT